MAQGSVRLPKDHRSERHHPLSRPGAWARAAPEYTYSDTAPAPGKPFPLPFSLNLVERYSCAAREQISEFTPLCAEIG
jgi:hypothetical protein